MNENEKTHNKNNRKITYQVGWKKGSIQFDEQGRMIKPKPYMDKLQQKSSTKDKLMADRDLLQSRRIMENIVWRHFPFIPISAVGLLFWLMPLISLGLTCFLVYALLTYPTY